MCFRQAEPSDDRLDHHACIIDHPDYASTDLRTSPYNEHVFFRSQRGVLSSTTVMCADQQSAMNSSDGRMFRGYIYILIQKASSTYIDTMVLGILYVHHGAPAVQNLNPRIDLKA